MTQIERQQEKELAYRASGVAVSLRWKRNTGGVMASSTTTRTPPTETENGSTMATHDKRSTGADRNADIVLGLAVIAMGLVAGLYFFSATAVMPALTAADDRTLVDAMQQMIVKIENPAFFLVFLGAPVLAAVALSQARRSGSAKTAGWILAGLALYAVMLVVTFAVHVPLNYDLRDAGDPARIENLAAVRDDFVTPWVAWEIVRTLASIAAFGSLAWALVLRGRMGRAA